MIFLNEEDREYLQTEDGKTIRLYKFDGTQKKYPSVTAVLGVEEKLYLREWKSRNLQSWEKIVLFANTVGTIAHYIIQKELADKWGLPSPELMLSGEQKYAYNQWFESFEYSDKFKSVKDCMGQIKMFMKDWIWDQDPQPPIRKIGDKTTEYPVYPFEVRVRSDKFGFAGSADIICSIDGVNCLVDIKSNDKEENYEYHYQTNGYYLGLQEQYPDLNLQKIYILSIPKESADSAKFYRFNFEPVTIDPTGWLVRLAKFYTKYGDIEPFSELKPKVFENIIQMGIDPNQDLSAFMRKHKAQMKKKISTEK